MIEYYKVEKVPDWLLDGLLKECTKSNCPDCNTGMGEYHKDECDLELCLNSGTQLMMCSCPGHKRGTWAGVDTLAKAAYDNRLVVFEKHTGQIMFDYNQALLVNIHLARGL